MANELNKNILIIYNPNAGKGKAQKFAKGLVMALGGKSELFCSPSLDVMRDFYKNNANNPKKYTLFIIIGGDGTIGPHVDSMIKNNIHVPIYAFGKGTANDFASYFHTNKSIKKAVKIIANGKLLKIDTIKVDMPNNKLDVHYAVSDTAGGAFTNGVTKYNKGAKRMFGKLAYKTTAVWKALWLKSQIVKFTIDGGETGEETFQSKIFLFYILNTKNVGGMKNAGSLAKPNDEMLDLVCIKKCHLWGKLCIGTSLLFNRLHKCKHVIYRQAKSFNVEIIGKNPIHNFTKTDTDGNVGGDYPLCVTIGPKVTVLVNN